MINPQYLIAKYIPDLQRFEPRNVGVIVWTPDGMAARFLGEPTDRPGEIDGRHRPAFMESMNAYRQWVRFWRQEIGQTEKDQYRNGTAHPITADVLETLKASSKGNFVVVAGGFLLDAVAPRELPGLTKYLFETLVALPEEKRQEIESRAAYAEVVVGTSFADRCEQLFQSVQLPASLRLVHNRPVLCKIGSGERKFQFDYALENGTLQGLYDRLTLPKSRGRAFEEKVDALAFKFDQVTKKQVVPREHTATFIDASEDQQKDDRIEKGLNVLNTVTQVVNVANLQKAAVTMEQFIPHGYLTMEKAS